MDRQRGKPMYKKGFSQRNHYVERFSGAISICDLVLNIAYFPEISRFFERLSAQVPFQEVLRVAFVPCTYRVGQNKPPTPDSSNKLCL